MLIDSHAHYDDRRFDNDRDSLLLSMKEHDVGYIFNIGADMPSSKKSIRLSETYDFVYATVGVHPHETDNMTQADIFELEKMLKHEKVKALGEIGLDYHYDFSKRENQRYWFEKQMELAAKVNMPVVIHEREATKDVLDVLNKFKGDVKGVVHCYSGSVETAKELIKIGYMISFNGIITFKNANTALKVIDAIDLKHIMLETDCPYLSPEPNRGKRNDSTNLKYVCEKIAQIKNIPYSEVAKITSENAMRFYNIQEQLVG